MGRQWMMTVSVCEKEACEFSLEEAVLVSMKKKVDRVLNRHHFPPLAFVAS